MIACKQKCSVMLRTHQIRFSPGFCLGPAWGAHDAPPDLGCYRERDTLSPFVTPSTPAAPHLELGGNLLQRLRGIDTSE